MKSETKSQIKNIRIKYASVRETVFKTAILCLMQHGAENLVAKDINEMVWEHPEISFVKGVYDCAVELANIPLLDLLEYIQTADLFYDKDKIPYKRLLQIATSLLSCIDEGLATRTDTYEILSEFLTDREINILGGDYILDFVKEDNE